MQSSKHNRKKPSSTGRDEVSGLLAFTELFPHDRACEEYLLDRLWNGHRPCPYCKHKKTYIPANETRYRCAKCKRKFKLTTRTIFASSRIPLRKWFIAIYLLTSRKKGYSSIQLGKDLGITQKAAWNLAMKIRTLLSQSTDISPLSGIVEIDEAYVGRKKRPEPGKRRKRGLGTTKTAIVGMVERGGRVIAVPLKAKPNMKTVESLAAVYVDPKARIMTDESQIYNNFGTIYPYHGTVNHGQRQYADGDINTNSIEGFWSQLKNSLLITHHSVSNHYVDLYCAEFSFRYSKRKESEFSRFDQLFDVSIRRPITRKGLNTRTARLFAVDKED